MKEKELIFQCEPCKTRLSDPAIQSMKDVWSQGETPCPHYPDQAECSPPRHGCIAMAGAQVARHVLQFYSEPTEENLGREIDRFAREAPLPPDSVEGYVDTGRPAAGLVTDAALVVERVREYARSVLDLKPGERVLPRPEESVLPPEGVE
jgi:hypothetical protein